MLAELGASHTHYSTPEDPAYYQLADIFSDALHRRGLQRVFPTGEVTYPGIGVFTQADDQGRTFMTGVVEGTPAHRFLNFYHDDIHPPIVSQGRLRLQNITSARRKCE